MLQAFFSTLFLENLFWFCALSGTFLFIIKSVLHLSPDLLEHSSLDGDDSFFHKIFSIHFLSSFLMTFGWTGLAFLKQLHFPQIQSLGLAFLFGCCMLLILFYLFKGAQRLVSRGSVFSVEQTLGKTGTVYHRIPADGTGKIQIVMEGFLHEVHAKSSNSQEIDSFNQVRVIAVIDEYCVSVEPFS